MAFPLIPPKSQWINSTGFVMAGGALEFRDPATDLPKDTYPTRDDAEAQTNANTNPVALDSRGEASIFLRDGEAYKVMLWETYDFSLDFGTNLLWTIDDVQAPLSGGASTVTIADTGGYYVATDVEAALQELGSTSGAGVIGVLDAAGHYSAATVEAVLAEIGVSLNQGGSVKGKIATTSRSATTTLADDPELYNWDVAGSDAYLIRGCLEVYQNVGDFKFQFGGTATFTDSFLKYDWRDDSGTTGGGSVADITSAQSITTATDTDQFRLTFTGGFVVATLGTIDFMWAQNTSSANATNLSQGSWIEVIRTAG